MFPQVLREREKIAHAKIRVQFKLATDEAAQPLKRASGFQLFPNRRPHGI